MGELGQLFTGELEAVELAEEEKRLLWKRELEDEDSSQKSEGLEETEWRDLAAWKLFVGGVLRGEWDAVAPLMLVCLLVALEVGRARFF